ncbi:MAG: hypothetical protein ACREEB_11420 [Caulobacteraceae bacterium]
MTGQALEVRASAPYGVVRLASLEACALGPLADTNFGPGNAVWCVGHDGPDGEVRLFDADGVPAALKKGVEIAGGIRARIIDHEGSTPDSIRGPGACTFLAMASVVGFKTFGRLPKLSPQWMAAIRAVA